MMDVNHAPRRSDLGSERQVLQNMWPLARMRLCRSQHTAASAIRSIVLLAIADVWCLLYACSKRRCTMTRPSGSMIR